MLWQIFSGNVPFQEIRLDGTVIFAVCTGNRPTRPSHELAISRGLEDTTWHLIETCWDQDPDKRPVVSKVVEMINALPNLPVDGRPADMFSDGINLLASYVTTTGKVRI